MIWVVYTNCACYVWPVAATYPVGRCKRCGTKPIGFYQDKADALDAFRQEHGKLPDPMEEMKL